jgi:hypothetical protein
MQKKNKFILFLPIGLMFLIAGIVTLKQNVTMGFSFLILSCVINAGVVVAGAYKNKTDKN